MAVFLSAEERSLVKSYLLLTYIQKKFDHDARMMEHQDAFDSPALYMEIIQGGIDRTNLLLSEVRRDLRRHQIRLYEVDRSEHDVQAQILCKGHHGTFHIPADEFYHEASARMRAYVGLSTNVTTTASTHTDDQSETPAFSPTRVNKSTRYAGNYAPYRTGA
ncbi:hypothetical protein [Paenibacillus campi]|uniref:hypothetical protein n=1 Tax=Paenibacillus campi TaxID=3106031 RepID=UPI002AFFADEF|nr:hypothetical protein [Paenibacillus sp. SGZ-1014]